MPERPKYLREEVAELGMGTPVNRREARQLLGRLKRLASVSRQASRRDAARERMRQAGASARSRSEFRTA